MCARAREADDGRERVHGPGSARCLRDNGKREAGAGIGGEAHARARAIAAPWQANAAALPEDEEGGGLAFYMGTSQPDFT